MSTEVEKHVSKAEETTVSKSEKETTQIEVASIASSPPEPSSRPPGLQGFFSAQNAKNIGAVLVKFARFTGPGTLISVAYVDPDNFQTGLDAGAQFKYKLLCVMLLGACMAVYLQVRVPETGLGRD